MYRLSYNGFHITNTTTQDKKTRLKRKNKEERSSQSRDREPLACTFWRLSLSHFINHLHSTNNRLQNFPLPACWSASHALPGLGLLDASLLSLSIRFLLDVGRGRSYVRTIITVRSEPSILQSTLNSPTALCSVKGEEQRQHTHT